MTVLLREAIGDRLRHARTNQSRTLREIAHQARVSLGYLSEVERGQKEASSELLASICQALELPLPDLLRNVATDVTALDKVEADAVGQSPEHPADEQSRAVASAAAPGDVAQGRLVPEMIDSEFAELGDLHSPAAGRVNPALRTTISAPKLAATAAA